MTRDAPRTLLVHDESPSLGGSVTTLGSLAPVLEDAGWRVAVAAMQPDGWDGLGLSPALLPRRGERVSGAAYFAREARRALDVARVARREGATVLLANNGPTANLSTHLAGRLLGLPVAQYVRGPFPATGLAARLLRRAPQVFAVGAEAARQVRDVAGLDAARVEEGIHPRFWPRRREAGGRGYFWSSALVEWKGLPLLLEAHRTLGPGAPPLTACYAGFPPGHPDAAPPPRALHEGVRLLRSPPGLDDLRAASLVYVHSATAPEPFGRSLLEAMAAGLCPIVPDAGTPGRIVRHMETGITYTRGSVHGLAAAMRLAARHPDLCVRLGDAAAEDARAYAAGRVFRPVVAGLERIVAPRGARVVPIRNEAAP